MKNIVKNNYGRILERNEIKKIGGGIYNFLEGYTVCITDCDNGQSIICMGTSSCVSYQSDDRCIGVSNNIITFNSCPQ